MKPVHRLLLPLLLLLAGPGLVSAQQPLGAEFLVSSVQTSGISQVATNAAGEFVVSSITHQDTSSGTLFVYARRYGAEGRPATPPIAVTPTLANASKQVVTMRADGSFAVAFTDRGKAEEPILRLRWCWGAGVLEQDSVVTREKVVDLAVAGREDGRFVLAWTSADDADPDHPTAVRARVFAADRSPATPEILVDPLGAWPAVAIGPSGELAVAWVHGDQVPSPAIHLQVQLRRLGADGTPDGPVTTVSPPTELGPLTLQLGKDGQGNIVLAESGTFEEWGQGTFVRRFRHDGKELGPALHLDHDVPAVSVGQAGNFVVGWTEPLAPQDDGSRDSRQIFARRFAEDGRPLGGNVAVTRALPGHRSLGQIAIGADGGLRGGLGQRPAGRVRQRRLRPALSEEIEDDEESPAFSVVDSACSSRILSAQTPIGGDILVSHARQFQFDVHVAVGARGDFVVSWLRQTSRGFALYARRYAASGAPASGEILVAGNYASTNSVAIARDGSFVVVFAYKRPIWRWRAKWC